MKILKSIPIILLAVVLAVTLALPVSADTAYPDSAPTIDQIDVYRNLLETGDRLYIWKAEVPYAALPATPFSETYIWRLIDTDGTTVLGSTVGYDFNDDGYNVAVFSMYFDASEALTWEEAYTIRLSGNPAVFTTPLSYNFPVASWDYTDNVTAIDNQAALAERVTTLANELNTDWGLAVAYYLTYESGSGTVLSTYGESYFQYVIYGLQSMAPTAFEYEVSTIELTERTWSSNYTDILEDQWTGTWVETAIAGSRALLGTSYDLTSIILLFIACAGLLFANLKISQNDYWSALIDVIFVMVIAARLGIYGLGFLGLIEAVCFIYIGMKLWGLKGQ